ncbi:uncharacterized protein LOC123536735 [Mercenaria mercenaria]|uniref:uncharacterized protein LOC123536735 n=1 Tax=Mercenaria mercenaria TaxID=6596 RepID=UPI00234E38AF|nr:uncharacterized protein LOC123536735 [Mercenaria mercenaria]
MGFSASNIFLIMVVFTRISNGKQCLKNDDIGWREGNIYECLDPLYPACCEVYRKFTCCEEPRNKNMREQLQLWGTLSLIALLLLVVYLYYNNDSQPCCSCSCDVIHALAAFFRRMRNTCSRRKKTFEVTDDKYLHESKGLRHTIPGSQSYQTNAYEKINVT